MAACGAKRTFTKRLSQLSATFGLHAPQQSVLYSITSRRERAWWGNGEADWRFDIDIDHPLEFGQMPH